MIRIFRNYNPFSVILLIIISLCLHFKTITLSVAPDFTRGGMLWETVGTLIARFLNPAPAAYTILAILLNFLQALQLNKFVVNAKIFPASNYLTALSYVIITALLPAWSAFTPGILANTLLIGMLTETYKLYNAPTANKNIFNIGFLLMTAILLQYSNLVFILFLIIAPLILHTLSVREWVLMLMGFFTPLYLYASFLFLTDAVPSGNSLLADLRFYLNPDWPLNLNIELLAGIIAVLTFTGVGYLNYFMDKMLMGGKRAWSIISVYGILAILAAIITPGRFYEQWVVTLPGLALLATNIWNGEKKRWFPQTIFLLTVLVAIFNQWVS